MPLQLAWTDPSNGTYYPSAYLYLDDVQIPSLYRGVRFLLSIYRDAAAKAEGLAPVYAQPVWLGVDESPVLTALREQFREPAYALLQTLPAFAGAVQAP